MLLTFQVGPYSYEDANTIQDRAEKDKVIEALVAGVGRLTPEVRCLGNGQEETFKKTTRTEKPYMTEKEMYGDIGPFPMGVFDDKRNVIGGNVLYAVKILSQTKEGYVVSAAPGPAYTAIDGKEWACAAFALVEYLLETPLTNVSGKTMSFDSLSFPIFYRDRKDPDWTEADGRMEAVEKEMAIRLVTDTDRFSIDREIDEVGRRISTMRKLNG